MTMYNMNRNSVIDAAKGIGIICVVLGHLVLYGSGVSRIIFAFHMPLFFFCSGAVFNYTGTAKGLLYKVRQLVIPYYFFTCIGLLVSVVFFRDGRLTFKRFLVDVFYTVNPEVCFVGQLWFLIALLHCIVLFYISHKMFSERERERETLRSFVGFCLLVCVLFSVF